MCVRELFENSIYVEFVCLFVVQGGVLASASVDGTMILWDLLDGSKTNILSQENGEAIRCCVFRYVTKFIQFIFQNEENRFTFSCCSVQCSPDGQNIVSSDDSGTVCLWGQNKSITR